MIILSIIFAILFTLLVIWAVKNSTDEWGNPSHFKISYLIILFLILLIPILNFIIGMVLIVTYFVFLGFGEIKLKENKNWLTKIINFLNKEI